MKLTAEKVCFSYRGKTVLHDISFAGNGGEVVGLMGPNGSGKTTLLKCIGGLQRAFSGNIRINGKDLAELSMKQTAKLVGYVPQDTGTNFSISVMNAVLLGRTPHIRYGASEKDIDIAERALEQMSLLPLAFRMMNELSGGERQRALIARALAQQPEILLLDEPTSSLDLRHQLETLEIIRQVAKEQMLLILISIHDLNLAGRFTDRILMMENGRLIANGTSEEVLTADCIRRIYGVESEVRYEKNKPFVFPMGVIH